MFQQTRSADNGRVPVGPFPARPYEVHSLSRPMLQSHRLQLSLPDYTVNYYSPFIGLPCNYTLFSVFVTRHEITYFLNAGITNVPSTLFKETQFEYCNTRL